MVTVLVDIKESDLINFSMVNQFDLMNMDENNHSKLFKRLPFTLYQKRMMGDDKVTIQIPLTLFLLFKGHSLVK